MDHDFIKLVAGTEHKYSVHDLAQDYLCWDKRYAHEVIGKLFATTVMTAPLDALISRIPNLNNGLQCYVKSNMVKHLRGTLYETLRERSLYTLEEISEKVTDNNQNARENAERYQIERNGLRPTFIPEKTTLLTNSLEDFVTRRIIEYDEKFVDYASIGLNIMRGAENFHASKEIELWKEYDHIWSSL